MKKARWPGEWKVVCQVCGFWYPSGDIKKRWDNLLVCKKDFETRHPQDFLRAKPERITPPFVSSEPADTFVHLCTIESQSAYADMGTADCAKADNTQFTYTVLLDLRANGH